MMKRCGIPYISQPSPVAGTTFTHSPHSFFLALIL